MARGKVKILFFMDALANAGGIQEMAVKWLENIDKSRFQIDVLAYDNVADDNYVDRLNALGSQVFILESFLRKGCFMKSLSNTWQFFREHSDYQILHAHASSKAFFILFIAKACGIRVRILHSHATRFLMTGRFALLVANLLKLPAKLCTTHYFACSPEAGSFLFGKSALQSGKITVVHNAIDTEQFQPSDIVRKEIRKELGVSDDEFLIGHVGRFHHQKNHPFLLEIYKAIGEKDKKSRCVCVGDGEERNSILQKAEELGIRNNVMFLGVRKDVNRLMQGFDLLLMPSLFEGLPVVGVEAQAVGTPALFSTEITRDAAILPSSSYLPLDLSAEQWAEAALGYKNKEREKNPHAFIVSNGYDIVVETKKLEEIYTRMVNDSYSK